MPKKEKEVDLNPLSNDFPNDNNPSSSATTNTFNPIANQNSDLIIYPSNITPNSFDTNHLTMEDYFTSGNQKPIIIAFETDENFSNQEKIREVKEAFIDLDRFFKLAKIVSRTGWSKISGLVKNECVFVRAQVSYFGLLFTFGFNAGLLYNEENMLLDASLNTAASRGIGFLLRPFGLRPSGLMFIGLGVLDAAFYDQKNVDDLMSRATQQMVTSLYADNYDPFDDNFSDAIDLYIDAHQLQALHKVLNLSSDVVKTVKWCWSKMFSSTEDLSKNTESGPSNLSNIPQEQNSQNLLENTDLESSNLSNIPQELDSQNLLENANPGPSNLNNISQEQNSRVASQTENIGNKEDKPLVFSQIYHPELELPRILEKQKLQILEIKENRAILRWDHFQSHQQETASCLQNIGPQVITGQEKALILHAVSEGLNQVIEAINLTPDFQKKIESSAEVAAGIASGITFQVTGTNVIEISITFGELSTIGITGATVFVGITALLVLGNIIYSYHKNGFAPWNADHVQNFLEHVNHIYDYMRESFESFQSNYLNLNKHLHYTKEASSKLQEFLDELLEKAKDTKKKAIAVLKADDKYTPEKYLNKARESARAIKHFAQKNELFLSGSETTLIKKIKDLEGLLKKYDGKKKYRLIKNGFEEITLLFAGLSLRADHDYDKKIQLWNDWCEILMNAYDEIDERYKERLHDKDIFILADDMNILEFFLSQSQDAFLQQGRINEFNESFSKVINFCFDNNENEFALCLLQYKAIDESLTGNYGIAIDYLFNKMDINKLNSQEKILFTEIKNIVETVKNDDKNHTKLKQYLCEMIENFNYRSLPGRLEFPISKRLITFEAGARVILNDPFLSRADIDYLFEELNKLRAQIFEWDSTIKKPEGWDEENAKDFKLTQEIEMRFRSSCSKLELYHENIIFFEKFKEIDSQLGQLGIVNQHLVAYEVIAAWIAASKLDQNDERTVQINLRISLEGVNGLHACAHSISILIENILGKDLSEYKIGIDIAKMLLDLGISFSDKNMFYKHVMSSLPLLSVVLHKVVNKTINLTTTQKQILAVIFDAISLFFVIYFNGSQITSIHDLVSGRWNTASMRLDEKLFFGALCTWKSFGAITPVSRALNIAFRTWQLCVYGRLSPPTSTPGIVAQEFINTIAIVESKFSQAFMLSRGALFAAGLIPGLSTALSAAVLPFTISAGATYATLMVSAHIVESVYRSFIHYSGQSATFAEQNLMHVTQQVLSKLGVRTPQNLHGNNANETNCKLITLPRIKPPTIALDSRQLISPKILQTKIVIPVVNAMIFRAESLINWVANYRLIRPVISWFGFITNEGKVKAFLHKLDEIEALYNKDNLDFQTKENFKCDLKSICDYLNKTNPVQFNDTGTYINYLYLLVRVSSLLERLCIYIFLETQKLFIAISNIYPVRYKFATQQLEMLNMICSQALHIAGLQIDIKSEKLSEENAEKYIVMLKALDDYTAEKIPNDVVDFSKHTILLYQKLSYLYYCLHVHYQPKLSELYLLDSLIKTFKTPEKFDGNSETPAIPLYTLAIGVLNSLLSNLYDKNPVTEYDKDLFQQVAILFNVVEPVARYFKIPSSDYLAVTLFHRSIGLKHKLSLNYNPKEFVREIKAALISIPKTNERIKDEQINSYKILQERLFIFLQYANEPTLDTLQFLLCLTQLVDSHESIVKDIKARIAKYAQCFIDKINDEIRKKSHLIQVYSSDNTTTFIDRKYYYLLCLQRELIPFYLIKLVALSNALKKLFELVDPVQRENVDFAKFRRFIIVELFVNTITPFLGFVGKDDLQKVLKAILKNFSDLFAFANNDNSSEDIEKVIKAGCDASLLNQMHAVQDKFNNIVNIDLGLTHTSTNKFWQPWCSLNSRRNAYPGNIYSAVAQCLGSNVQDINDQATKYANTNQSEIEKHCVERVSDDNKIEQWKLLKGQQTRNRAQQVTALARSLNKNIFVFEVIKDKKEKNKENEPSSQDNVIITEYGAEKNSDKVPLVVFATMNDSVNGEQYTPGFFGYANDETNSQQHKTSSLYSDIEKALDQTGANFTTANQWYTEGYKYDHPEKGKERNIPMAKRCYENALALEKHHRDANRSIGILYYHENNIEKALEYYYNFMAENVRPAQKWYLLGKEFERKDNINYSLSSRCYQKTLDLEPDHKDANYELGRNYRHNLGVTRNHLHARTLLLKSFHDDHGENSCYRKAYLENELNIINKDDKNAQVWAELGYEFWQPINGRERDYYFARICFETALELDRSNVEANYFMGALYEFGYAVTTDRPKARTYYENVMQNNSNYLNVQKRYEEAGGPLLAYLITHHPIYQSATRTIREIESGVRRSIVNTRNTVIDFTDVIAETVRSTFNI